MNSKELSRVARLIRNDPVKYCEEMGMKFHWYQKICINMVAKFENLKDKIFYLRY